MDTLTDIPQLSFDLGTRPSNRPDFGTVKITGALLVGRDIQFGEEVTVTVVDGHGEVFASGTASCDWPRFKTRPETQAQPASTERIHTVKVDG